MGKGDIRVKTIGCGGSPEDARERFWEFPVWGKEKGLTSAQENRRR